MAERVFQAGLGTEWERVYKEGSKVSSLLLAQVIKVNYKFNSVDLVTNGDKDTFRSSHVNNGKFSAKLPLEFGGRNSVGQPYGQVRPVNVGDTVLVGFVEQNKSAPVVLSVYGTSAVSEMLTRTPFDSADYNDETLTRQTNQKFSLYPSLTYDNIDGDGNRTATFTGKSFVIVSAGDNKNSGVTDGNHGTEYDELETSYYANDEEIEPMSPYAPNVLFKHQGILTQDGEEDNHVTLIGIKDDGTYRVSTMDKADDWRTYFEMTPNGGVKLRKQFDSKVIGQALTSSELGIAEDGTVYIKNGDTYLEVKADGIYSNGLNLDIDLSEIQKTLDEQGKTIVLLNLKVEQTAEKFAVIAEKTEVMEGQIKDFRSELVVMADEISSKVSEAQVKDIINQELGAITSDIEKIKEDNDRLNKIIADIADDGLVTPLEKDTLLREWEVIQDEYPTYVLQADDYAVDKTAYTKAYDNLEKYITPILANMDETSAIDPTEFRAKFKNYYDERLNVLTAILMAIRGMAVEAMKKASEASVDASNAWREATQAQADANKANSLIADIASDGKLTPSEKYTLKREYDTILKEHPTVLEQGDKYEVDTSSYVSSYDTLVSFVDTNRLFTDMGETVAVDGEQLRKVFSDYYLEKVKLLRAVTDKAKDITDDHEGRIYVAETQIKQTSEYISLLATKVETIGETVETHTAELKVQSEEISQKVTATQVAKQISDLELGMTNNLRNSGLLLDDTYWRDWGTAPTGTRGRVEIEGLPNLSYGFKVSTTNEGSWGYAQDNVAVLPDTEYTASFWARSQTGIIEVALQKGNGSNDDFIVETKEVSSKWTRVTYTWKTSSETTKTSYYLGLAEEAVGTALIAGMKLETGSKATAWSSSPLDSKAEIQDELNKLPIGGTNYVAFSSGNKEYPRLMIKNVGHYANAESDISFDGETVKFTPKTAGTQGMYDMGTSNISTARVGLASYGITATQAGDYLTFSADVKVTGGTARAHIYLLNNGAWKEYSSDVIRPTDGTKRAVVLAPIDSGTEGVLCRILGSEGFTQVNFAKAQLETGMKSTSWKKSHFDLENDVTNAVTSSKNEVLEVVSLTDIKARIADGLLLYPDPNFEIANNELVQYNNSLTANPTITRELYQVGHTQPSGSPRLKIEVHADLETSPNLGGVKWGHPTRANAEFVYKIVANIPAGYALNFGTNSIGTAGKVSKWLTNNTGTGTWETYYYYIKCGSTGDFLTTGFFHLAGVAPTTGNKVTWYIDYASVFDITRSNRAEMTEQLNGKEGSIMKQPNAPINPAVGLIWVDTTNVPNVAKRWTGTEWVKLSPTEAREIDAFSDSDGRDLIDRMSSAEQVITAESITNTVLSSEDFSSLFAGKANAEDLLNLATTEQLENQYHSLEAMLGQQLGEAYSTLFERQSELEQLVNGFDFKIQQAGGINMLRNSLGFSGLDFWGDVNSHGRNLLTNANQRGLTVFAGSVLTNTGNVSVGGTLGYTVTGTVGTNNIFAIMPINNPNYGNVGKKDQKYVHSIQIRNNAESSYVKVDNNFGVSVEVPPQTTQEVILVGTAGGTQAMQFVFSVTEEGQEINFTFWNPKVEEGAEATPWSPAPEDGLVNGGLSETTQDNALANLGFGSGFVHKAGGVRSVQDVTLPAKGTYTMSFFMKKSTSSGAHGGAGIELFSNGGRLAFVGAEEGVAVGEYTKYSYTFETESLDVSVQMVAWGNINTTVTLSGLMFNIGTLALTWQPYPAEIYNTNVLIDINGITVKNNQTNGYTLITPTEFSGYAQVGNDMKRVFTLNGKTTEVEEISVRTKIIMGTMTVLAVSSPKNKGWAFIGQ